SLRLTRRCGGRLVYQPPRVPDPPAVGRAPPEPVQSGDHDDVVVGVDEGLRRSHAVVPERHRAPGAEVARSHHHAKAGVANALLDHRPYRLLAEQVATVAMM